MKVIISVIFSLFIFNCQSFAEESDGSSNSGMEDEKRIKEEKVIEYILSQGAVLLVDIDNIFTSNSKESSYTGKLKIYYVPKKMYVLDIKSPFISNRIMLMFPGDFPIFRSKMEVFRAMLPEIEIWSYLDRNKEFNDEIGEPVSIDILDKKYDGGLIDFMAFSMPKDRGYLILFFRTINASGASIDGAIYLTSPQVFKILDNITEEEIKKIDEQYEIKESKKSKEFDPLGERLKAIREAKKAQEAGDAEKSK